MLDQIIIFFAEYVYILIAGIAFCFVILSDTPTRKAVLAIGVFSSVIALIADKVLNQIIVSPRPFVVENITPLFPHVASNGFPSEHALFAMVIASTIFLHNKKLGSVLIVLTLGIGVARILANVHYPVDIFGGLVIGLVAVFIGRYIFSFPEVKNIFHSRLIK
ncbi:MAG: Bacitracin transport permease protein BCRC [Parcubacteria group bacterium GW2011_GWA2_40_14]|nr:MAG: Bacitracin transport permease protein BCRC [Parcubacteria group bacterium GW2011_GWA2_40_14]